MGEGASLLQTVVNGGFAAIMALGGMIVRNLQNDHKELERKHDELVDKLPGTYARRDDVKATFDEVKQSLRRIEDRLGTTPPH